MNDEGGEAMKNLSKWTTAASAAAALLVASVALAQALPKGQAVMSSVDVTATVVKIDHKTRAVTLKADDGVDDAPREVATDARV
jgi:hypothetical protein